MAAVYDRAYAPYHASMVARILDLAGLSESEKILELGCGTGVLALEAARRIHAPGFVIGIDSAAGMVELAAKSRRIGSGTVRFAQVDNRKLAFRDGAFDAVLSCFGIGSLGHKRALQEACRVLKGDGRLAMCHWSGEGSKAPSVVGLMTRFRPKELPDEMRRLIEARRSLNATGEPKAMMSPETVVAALSAIGFRETTYLEKSERVVYADPAAYLARGLAMGDNEREFRLMDAVNRAAFLRAFDEAAAAFVTEEASLPRWGSATSSPGSETRGPSGAHSSQLSDPRMARVAVLEGPAEPEAPPEPEPRLRPVEVCEVFRLRIFRLVEEHELWTEVRDTSIRSEGGLRERAADASVLPEHPVVVDAFVQEELEFPRGARRPTGVDLVDGRVQPLSLTPRISPDTGHLLELPSDEVGPDRSLVPAEDGHVDVLVGSRHLRQEQVDRPAARDEPGTIEPRHQFRDFEDGRERFLEARH